MYSLNDNESNQFRVKDLTFKESGTAGLYTAELPLKQNSAVLDFHIIALKAWNGNATLNVGDVKFGTPLELIPVDSRASQMPTDSWTEDNGDIFWYANDRGIDEWIELDYEISKLTNSIILKCYKDRYSGIADVTISGPSGTFNLGSIDFYGGAVWPYFQIVEENLNIPEALIPGTYSIRFTTTGKNVSSLDYWIQPGSILTDATMTKVQDGAYVDNYDINVLNDLDLFSWDGIDWAYNYLGNLYNNTEDPFDYFFDSGAGVFYSTPSKIVATIDTGAAGEGDLGKLLFRIFYLEPSVDPQRVAFQPTI